MGIAICTLLIQTSWLVVDSGDHLYSEILGNLWESLQFYSISVLILVMMVSLPLIWVWTQDLLAVPLCSKHVSDVFVFCPRLHSFICFTAVLKVICICDYLCFLGRIHLRKWSDCWSYCLIGNESHYVFSAKGHVVVEMVFFLCRRPSSYQYQFCQSVQLLAISLKFAIDIKLT